MSEHMRLPLSVHQANSSVPGVTYKPVRIVDADGLTIINVGPTSSCLPFAIDIVAACNACSGMADPAAEIDRLRTRVEDESCGRGLRDRELATLTQQRDELAAALERAQGCIKGLLKRTPVRDVSETLAEIEHVLAKVKP